MSYITSRVAEVYYKLCISVTFDIV